MQAAELIDHIIDAGGQIRLEGAMIHAVLPAAMRPLERAIRSLKADLITELARRPEMPTGIRLIRWQPKEPPVQLSEFETVTDTHRFIQTTLRQLDARVRGGTWLAGNRPLTTLLFQLEAVGCWVALEASRRALH
jgi:hypothetical protein